jgi:sugar phosphate isomerase/epimerase
MLIGCCCPVENAYEAQAAGFDYIECTVVSLLPEEDDVAASAIIAKHNAAVLPVRAFNVFLPRDLKIVGPEVDQERIQKYLKSALARVQQIGAQLVVFGSGGARSIPDGFPRDEAVHQMTRFLHTVADIADYTELAIAVEPLNRRESNVINSVAEAVALAKRVDRPSVRVLADFYHMSEEHEPLSHLVDYRDWILHVHVADTDRYAPGTGQYPYEQFGAALRRADYAGMVSVECRWNDFSTEAPRTVDFLRRTLGKKSA